MKIVFFLASLPEDELEKRQFPLGAGLIGAYLEKHLRDIEVIITANVEDIIKENPDILGISSVSQCFTQAKSTAKLVKRELGIPIVLGGYHISPLPHILPQCFDIGVIGEGEKPMLEIVKVLQREKSLDPNELENIGSICFHNRHGNVVTTPITEPLSSIDILPFPKRNIHRGARNIHMFSSRGCVYQCKYCASCRHWRIFRVHSAEYVVSELKYLIDKYDATSIHLLDDLFFADRKRLYTIAELMEKEDLIGRFTFHGFITSNLAKRDMLKVATHIGFKSIRFGAETGSDRLLKDMKGKWASVENHQRCIDLCQELGLEVSAAFMVGTPGETEEDLQLTYQFLKRNADVLRINGLYLTTPMPGTSYWDLAMQKGLVSEDENMDWSRLNLDIMKEKSFDFHDAIYLNEDNMPLEAVIEYARRFQDEFTFRSIGHTPKEFSPLADGRLLVGE